MSAMPERKTRAFDREVERDWSRFRRVLTEFVTGGAPRALQLAPLAADERLGMAVTLLRDGDVAWARLSLHRRPGAHLHGRLLEAGYRPLRSEVAVGRRRRSLDIPGEFVDQADVSTYGAGVDLCRRLVTVLRDLSVVHPAMLTMVHEETDARLTW